MEEVVAAYEFNMQTNEMHIHMIPNPYAGQEHHFVAYRSKGYGELKEVRLVGYRG